MEIPQYFPVPVPFPFPLPSPAAVFERPGASPERWQCRAGGGAAGILHPGVPCALWLGGVRPGPGLADRRNRCALDTAAPAPDAVLVR